MPMNDVFDLLAAVERDLPEHDLLGYSTELEIAVNSGAVKDSRDLIGWCRDILSGAVTQGDLPTAAAAWHWVDDWLAGSESYSTVQPSAPSALQTLNNRYALGRNQLSAVKISAGSGRALVRRAELAPPGGTIPPLVSAWVDLSMDPGVVQFPLAWGLVCRVAEIDLRECMRGMVDVITRSICESAARLIAISPRDVMDVQRIMLPQAS